MFSAHIVFGDLDNHSALPTRERIDALQRFWAVCDHHKPVGLSESLFSFYSVDNDSLTAGFSDVPELYDGLDVIRWAVDLQKALIESGVSATFAANLVAVGRTIDWRTVRGFTDNSEMIYVPDSIVDKDGKALRPRMVGDMLIVTARLLELGKKLNEQIIVSALNGGNLGFGFGVRHGEGPEGFGFVEVTDSYMLLGETKANWLWDRSVRAFSIPPNHPLRGK